MQRISESDEQKMLFEWAALRQGKYPELALMHHIPNGGARSPVTAARLKCEGVRRGVPDICLPVARGGYHGLYIELKRRKGGTVSVDQKRWLQALSTEGYAAIVCRGWAEAAAVIERYIGGGMQRRKEIDDGICKVL